MNVTVYFDETDRWTVLVTEDGEWSAIIFDTEDEARQYAERLSVEYTDVTITESEEMQEWWCYDCDFDFEDVEEEEEPFCPFCHSDNVERLVTP